ncbi:MAG TPA: sodium:solute symporter family protein [Spirochaetota bacterium]|nr:sodium:solute symporter family protein [Spirochaetota bacterium]
MNLAIIIIYFLGMIAVGAVSLRHSQSLSGYLVANRKGGAFVITGSLLATILGGSSTMGMAGLGYSWGLVGAWWLLSGVAGMAVLSLWLSRRIRALSVYTLPEILEKQYGSPAVKIIISALISVAWIGIIAGQTIACGKILSVLWPGNSVAFIILSGAVFIAYTALGGQYSVIKTDVIQFFIIVAGVAVCVVYGISSAGGLSRMFLDSPAGHWSFPLSESFGTVKLLTFLFFVGLPYLAGPDIYSRLFSARTPEVARRSSAITALILIPAAFGITLIGMVARVLLPGISPENSFPSLAMYILPVGLNGLVIAALLAAVMSSASTCLLTTGTILTMDVIAPIGGKKLGEGMLLLLSRVMVIIAGIIAVLVAIFSEGIISALLLAYTVYSAGVVVPLLLGFYARRLRLNQAGAISAALGGGSLALALKLAGFNDLILISLPVSAILLFMGSAGWAVYGRRRG